MCSQYTNNYSVFTQSVPEPKDDPPSRDTSKLTQQTDSQSTPAGDCVAEAPAKPKKAFTGVRVSRFRHLHGTPMHKSNNIENVRNLSISLPGDSDAFQVNQEFAAFPLSGPGGQIAVVSVSFNLCC